ncbi:MAG: methionyl-tRNA formyltransferase [Candidatus Omnitrophica bacterium]|nr:methionyl-tRNA formyltransferase [Candidatus Omnitrophota bacterium]
MRITFFGSGKFAVTILEALHKHGHEIKLVVTQPDRKKGRHLHLSATPVKEYSLLNGFTIFQPADINSTDSIEILKKSDADLFIVVSYGRILCKAILALPGIMAVNIHASLLPKYRGAAPINRAIMNGDSVTGITFIRMNERMDEGGIIFQKALKIERDDNALTLDGKLSILAASHINSILDKIAAKKIRPKNQDDKKATYAPLMNKQEGLIHWEDPGEKIINNFRGCYGWPGTFTYYKGMLLKVTLLEKGRFRSSGSFGEILAAYDNLLEVACGKGSIVIKEVLPESHHRMSVKSFLAGHHVKIGEKLGC